MENATDQDAGLAALRRWAESDQPSSDTRSSSSTPSATNQSLGGPSTSTAPTASTGPSPSTSPSPSRPTPSTSRSSGPMAVAPPTATSPVVVVVQDEVRREHSIKGSLDAKVKGTSLPAIEVSLSWNNASTVKTTSKTRLVPGRYPTLPQQDPTPAVPYPQPTVLPVSSAASTASVVSVAGPSRTEAGATSSGCSAQP